jgi:Peptidase family M20/M25/M40
MTGSHIDTVGNGGRFDGIYGVIAGLEVLKSLRDAGLVTVRPLAVTIFTNEEGVRFQPDMTGSLVYSGGLTLDEALNAKAVAGRRFKPCRDDSNAVAPRCRLLCRPNRRFRPRPCQANGRLASRYRGEHPTDAQPDKCNSQSSGGIQPLTNMTLHRMRK